MNTSLDRKACSPYVMFSVLILLAVSLPHALTDPIADAAVFIYAGEGILAGDIPYVDMIDAKPPVIFYLSALIRALPGPVRIWIALFESVSIIAAGILILNAYPSNKTRWIAGLTYAGMIITLGQDSHLTEYYALPLQIASALLISRIAVQQDTAPHNTFIFGLLGAVLFMLRQNLIGILIAGFLYVVSHKLAARKTKEALRFALITAAGFAFGLLPIFVHLLAVGALESFWQASFVSYVRYSSGATLGHRAKSIAIIIQQVPWLVMAAAIWLATVVLKPWSRKESGLFRVALWLFPTEVVLAGISGQAFLHYFVPLAVPTVLIIAGIAESSLKKPDEHNASKLLYIATIVFLCVVTLPGLRSQASELEAVATGDKYGQLKTAITTLDVSDRNTLFVWGYGTEAYLWAETRSATPYFHHLAFQYEGYPTEIAIDRILADLSANPPEYIVDRRVFVPPLDASMRGAWKEGLIGVHPTKPKLTMFREVEPFLRFVDQNYTLVGEGRDFTLFKRR